MNTERTEKFVNAIACDLEEGGFRQVSGTMLRRTLATAVSAALPLLPPAKPDFDVEAMLSACVPGGSIVDPQVVADNIRAWVTERKPAEPTEPSGNSGEMAEKRGVHDALAATLGELSVRGWIDDVPARMIGEAARKDMAAALAATGKQQVGAPWRDHDAAIDAKALATATEIALMWGQDRSQFVSRIQVAVIDAMKWIKSSQQPAPGIDPGQFRPAVELLVKKAKDGVTACSMYWGQTNPDATEKAAQKLAEAERLLALIDKRDAAPGVG